MSYEQQKQNPGQNQQGKDYSNQGKTAQVGNNTKKDEPTAQSGKDGMKNEGGSCSTSGKSSQGNPKSSNA